MPQNNPNFPKNLTPLEPKLNDHTFSISLGNLINVGQSNNESFSIETNNLTKHILVCGTTGSGKTNTVAHIVDQLEQNDLPYLILEPTKSEHRHLALSSNNQTPRIYTPGEEKISPLRVNPFEIMPGISVSAHIAHLQSIFRANLEMRNNMPYVLTKALERIYTKRGWDLSENKNLRLIDNINPDDPNYPASIYPTMSDLYDAIVPAAESLDYTESITSEICTALRTRVGKLLEGPIGQVIASRSSVQINTLFSQSTIIELNNIVDSQEKSLIASILLLFLYEFRKVSGFSKHLKHVLVLEDGQHLLKSSQSTNSNNSACFAQLFSDMLAEMRSYGQGMIISAQSPGQLIPEILSNTNLKIIHRLVTETDLNAVSAGSNFDAYKNDITTLSDGKAVVHSQNEEKPHIIHVPEIFKNALFAHSSEKSNKLVADYMSNFKTNKSWHHLGCDYCLDPSIFELASLVANDWDFKQLYNNYILRIMKDNAALINFRPILINEIQRLVGGKTKFVDIAFLTWCTLCQSTEKYFEYKGEENYWSYNEIREQQIRLLKILKTTFLPSAEHTDINSNVIKKWQDDFIELHQRDIGPLTTCNSCTAKCLYRFEVAQTITDPKVRYDFSTYINREDTIPSESAAEYTWQLSEKILGQKDSDLAYCIAAHLLREQDLSNDAQLVLAQKVKAALEKFQKEALEKTFKDSSH